MQLSELELVFVVIWFIVMEKAMEFEKLKEDNWPIWKIMIEDHLVYKELDLPLLGKDVKHSSMSDEEWKSLDRNACQ